MRLFKDILLEESISIEDHLLDYNHNQYFCKLIAYQEENMVGNLDYSIYNNTIYIQMLEVKENYRRQKIGTLLFKALQEIANKDNYKIVKGYTTDQGEKFVQSLQESSKTSYDHGCLMLYLNIPKWDKLLQKIDEDDLYYDENDELGTEPEPHCTVLYGFLLEYLDIIQLKSDIKKLHPVEIILSQVSAFQREEKLYDVLKFDIESKYLHKVNSYFRKHYEYTSDFPDYHPHVTIAYVKKGKADKYIKRFKNMKPLKFQSNRFVFSGKDPDNKMEIVV